MAQILAYVNTKAQAVKAYLDKDKPEQASAQLEQLASAAREVYTDAREGIMALRTRVGPDQPLSEALQDYVERWELQSGIAGSLEIEGEIQVSATVELQLLRILQEALSNTRKHSGATQVEVRIHQERDRLIASVEDDGTGFDPSNRPREAFPRFGLAIMRERAESIGGSLDLETSPGSGTRVKIEVPFASTSF